MQKKAVISWMFALGLGLGCSLLIMPPQLAHAQTGKAKKSVKTKKKKGRKAEVKAVACPALSITQQLTKVETKEGADIYQSADRGESLVVRCETSTESPNKVLKSWKAQHEVTRITPTAFYFEEKIGDDREHKDKSSSKQAGSQEKSPTARIRVYIQFLNKKDFYLTLALVVRGDNPAKLAAWHSKILSSLRKLN